MLRELHISNLAVIADARIEFAAGLNCFTGATGAGKSLVIGAVELLLGLRSGGDLLRSGADEARVSGMFETRDKAILKAIDDVTDASISGDGGELLLTRKLYASGRSSVSLNGNPITLGMLKQIGELLVDVHGQHDHQFLLKPSNQLSVLDHFAGLESSVEEYRGVFTQLRDAREKLASLSTGERLRLQQLDLLKFQANEIDTVEPDAEEFAELEGRGGLLSNLEKIKRDAGAAQSILYDADGSAIEQLKMVYALLADLSNMDPQLKPIAELVREGVVQLEESSFDLSRYMQKLDLDPGELEEINQRLNAINRLMRKYGNRVEDVIAFRRQIGEEISELENAGQDESKLKASIDPLLKRLMTLGQQLSKVRQKAAAALAPAIEAQLGELGMEKAKFRAEFVANQQPQPSGLEALELMVQTNPGLAAAPLRKIASGGELGRVMLALKTVLAQSKNGDTGTPAASVLVFDEIDANIGGRLGAIIGSKLRELSTHHQVLCITHLPQIAAYADRHITVRKEQGDDTKTTVRQITGDVRVQELAEMIGGKHITDTTRAQARELLESATELHRPPSKLPAKKPVASRKRQAAD